MEVQGWKGKCFTREEPLELDLKRYKGFFWVNGLGDVEREGRIPFIGMAWIIQRLETTSSQEMPEGSGCEGGDSEKPEH